MSQEPNTPEEQEKELLETMRRLVGAANQRQGAPEQPPDDDQPSPAPSQEDAPKEDTEKGAAPPRPRRRPVVVYLAILFAAAFLMLLLAYLVQQRNNQAALNDLNAANALSRNELIEENEALREQVGALEAQLETNRDAAAQRDELKGELTDLLQEVIELCRREDILTAYAVLEQNMRLEDYEAAAYRAWSLRRSYTADQLDLGIAGQAPDGSDTLDLNARLDEIIARLEELGYPEPDATTVTIPIGYTITEIGKGETYTITPVTPGEGTP